MKPYQFVPLSRKVNREPLRPRNQMNTNLHYGMWELKAQVITPLLIRSGKLDEFKGRLVQGIVMNQGRPVLPGSSIKGMIRSIYEAVTYSCLLNSKIGWFKKEDEETYFPTAQRRSCTGPHICPACQLFGFTGKEHVGKSLVQFADFVLQGDPQQWLAEERVPSLYGPLRDRGAIKKYLDDEKLLQRKFYTHGQPQNHGDGRFLVIQPGAEFRGRLHYEHVTDQELGRLAFAFGLGSKGFVLKLGYGKPAYFGSIRFELINVTPYRSFAFQSAPLTKEEVLGWADTVDEDDPFIKRQRDHIRHIFDYETHKNKTWSINQYGIKGY